MVGSDGMGCIYKASSSQGRRVEMVCLRKSGHWRGSCFLCRDPRCSPRGNPACRGTDSSQPHGLQHARLPCPSPAPRACSPSAPQLLAFSPGKEQAAGVWETCLSVTKSSASPGLSLPGPGILSPSGHFGEPKPSLNDCLSCVGCICPQAGWQSLGGGRDRDLCLFRILLSNEHVDKAY